MNLHPQKLSQRGEAMLTFEEIKKSFSILKSMGSIATVAFSDGVI